MRKEKICNPLTALPKPPIGTDVFVDGLVCLHQPRIASEVPCTPFLTRKRQCITAGAACDTISDSYGEENASLPSRLRTGCDNCITSMSAMSSRRVPIREENKYRLGCCQGSGWAFSCPAQDELVVEITERSSESIRTSREGRLISPIGVTTLCRSSYVLQRGTNPRRQSPQVDRQGGEWGLLMSCPGRVDGGW